MTNITYKFNLGDTVKLKKPMNFIMKGSAFVIADIGFSKSKNGYIKIFYFNADINKWFNEEHLKLVKEKIKHD
jgi:hypothetical protein